MRDVSHVTACLKSSTAIYCRRWGRTPFLSPFKFPGYDHRAKSLTVWCAVVS